MHSVAIRDLKNNPTNMPLLIDEKKGRNVAQNMDIGLIGIIRFLHKKEKISTSSFRVSKSLWPWCLNR